MTENFTAREYKALCETRLPNGGWAYMDNAQSFIYALCERGLMKPRYGQFVQCPPSKQANTTLLGEVIPIVGDMVSVYELTPLGQTAFDVCAKGFPDMSISLARQAEIEDLRDRIAVSEFLAMDFGKLALQREKAGQLDTAARARADATRHWAQAHKLQQMLKDLGKEPNNAL